MRSRVPDLSNQQQHSSPPTRFRAGFHPPASWVLAWLIHTNTMKESNRKASPLWLGPSSPSCLPPLNTFLLYRTTKCPRPILEGMLTRLLKMGDALFQSASHAAWLQQPAQRPLRSLPHRPVSSRWPSVILFITKSIPVGMKEYPPIIRDKLSNDDFFCYLDHQNKVPPTHLQGLVESLK